MPARWGSKGDNVEQTTNQLRNKDLARKIILDHMYRINFDLFKKGYITSRRRWNVNVDPEIDKIEKKIAAKLGENILLGYDIQVIARPKRHRKTDFVSLAQIPEKYHLIKPILQMIQKEVQRLPPHKRLSKENRADFNVLRQVLAEDNGYLCESVVKDSKDGKTRREWRIVHYQARTKLLKLLDVLKEQSAYSQLSQEELGCLPEMTVRTLRCVQNVGETKKFINFFLKPSTKKLLVEWNEHASKHERYRRRDLIITLESDHLEAAKALLQVVNSGGCDGISINGYGRDRRLSTIFGKSLELHYKGLLISKARKETPEPEFQREAEYVSLTKEDVLNVFPKLKKLPDDVFFNDKINIMLGDSLAASSSYCAWNDDDIADPIVLEYIKGSFLEKLKDNRISLEELNLIFIETVKNSLQQEIPKKLKNRERQKARRESDDLEEGISILAKDFPAETEQYLSATPTV